MTKLIDKPIPAVPTPKTFADWVVFAVLVAGVLAVLTLVFSSLMDFSRDTQEKTETTVSQFMSAYEQDGFNFDHGKNNGSMWGNVTLNISDGHGVHACRNISMDTLRDHAPIECSDGAVIKAK